MRTQKIIFLLVCNCLFTVMSAVPIQSLPSATINDFTETPELWTCGAEDWAPRYARCTGIDEQAATGKWAVVLNFCAGYEQYLAFPKWRNANWDLSDAACLEFKVKLPKGMILRGANPTVYLRNQDGPFFRIRPENRRSLFNKASDGKWQSVRVPITNTPGWETFCWLDPSLADIDFLEIAFGGNNTPKNAAHYILVDDVRFGPQQPVYTPPNSNAGDLDVLIIERDPKYERYNLPQYDGINMAVCDNKDNKHYPDTGEQVTFTAYVQNKGKKPLKGTYEWIMDGKVVGSGKVSELKPREKASFTWQWPWDPGDHDLTFRIVPDGEDYCPRNNTLTIRTNAIMLKHVIENGTLARVEQKVNMIGSYSFEDWLQGQVRFMNQLFAESKYPFAPSGITTRVMIGKFEYIDDGQLLATCPWGPFQVGEQDITLDGGRGCTMLDTFWDNGEQSRCYLNFENFQGRPDGAWLHEVSHQIGVIDDYQFITEPEDNKVNGVGFTYARRGLMGGGEIYPYESPGTLYSLYAPGDVHGLNVTKGKRRGYFGEYLYCMARTNSLVVMDTDGSLVTNAIINVYQTDGRKIDTQPEHEGVTDSRGRFLLKNRPVKGGVTETGCELHDNPFGRIHVVGFNGVFLVVVQAGENELYGFTTIQEFNVAWASGQKNRAEIPVVVKEKGDEKTYTAPRPMPKPGN
jgi:hypothetical protein